MGEIVKELFGKEPSRGVNPDEVVAMGAAIQVCNAPIYRGLPSLLPSQTFVLVVPVYDGVGCISQCGS